MARSRMLQIFAALSLLAVSLTAAEQPTPARQETADYMRIEKSRRRLLLFSKGSIIREYKITLGSQSVGAKERMGDGRTPEGTYVVDGRNAKSRFHRSLHISYPNAKDRRRAARLGVPPGGDIMIHGIRNGFGWVGPLHRLLNWTDGCIAVKDSEIEEIWSLVPDKTKVEIIP